MQAMTLQQESVALIQNGWNQHKIAEAGINGANEKVIHHPCTFIPRELAFNLVILYLEYKKHSCTLIPRELQDLCNRLPRE